MRDLQLTEAIYAEEVFGKVVFDGLINMKMLDAKKAVGSIYVQNVNSVYEIFNPYRSYAKGAMVLHMLRGVVGDSIFDVSIFDAAGFSIAFNSHDERVKNSADVSIESKDLRDILPYFI